MPVPVIQKLPCEAGIGLRAIHYQEVIQNLPSLSWVEVHSENFFGGGADLQTLLKVRDHYPISLHGVGLGLASPVALDSNHLQALRHLCEAVQPASVSEHLSWNNAAGDVINDLLPFPYTHGALDYVASRIHQVQEILGRQVLIENLSSYIAFNSSEMSEGEFLAALTHRTGCGILFDVNNLYVNSHNLGVDALSFIESLPAAAVGEFHLAGHSLREGCLVDTHSASVCTEVWQLYHTAMQHIGPRPTLIEWDADIPALSVLIEEAAHAQRYMDAMPSMNVQHECMA